MKSTLLVLVLSTTVLYGQQEIQSDLLNVKEMYSEQWTEYVQHPDFLIEYKFESCDFSSGLNKELLLLKVTNLTNQQLDLEWHIQLYYGDTCSTCQYPTEYNRTITVNSNDTVEGLCTPDTSQPLVIFSKFTDARFAKKSRRLHMFKLANLTIN